MSFSANLAGLALPDILQIISLGRLSGVATVKKGTERFRLVFREGRVLHANHENHRRLGDRLISKGIVSEKDIEDALAYQKSARHHEPLASILTARELVYREVLEAETREHIREVFNELLSWDHGSFTFQPSRVDGHVTLLREGIETAHLLIGAAIANDEREAPEPAAEVVESLLEFVP